MNRFYSLFLLIACLPGVTMADSTYITLRQGDRPRFTATTIDNRKVEPSAMAGRIVVIQFWASWSIGSRMEMPLINQLQERYRRRGVGFLGINCDHEPTALKAYLTENQIRWPQVYENHQNPRVTSIFFKEGYSLPATVMLATDGTLIWSGSSADLEAAIEDALVRYPPQLPESEWRRYATEYFDLAALALRQGDYDAAAAAFAGIRPEYATDLKFLARAYLYRDLLTPSEQNKEQWTRAVRNNPSLARWAELIIAFKPEPPKVERLEPTPSPPATDTRSRGDSTEPSVGLYPGSQTGTSLNPWAPADAQPTDASPTPAGTTSTSPSSPAAGRPKPPEIDDATRAERRLRIAEQYRSATRHTDAYPIYREIVAAFPKTPAGEQAAGHVRDYEADTEFMKSFRQSIIEAEARSHFTMAMTYLDAGKVELARQKLRYTIEDFPNTKAAHDAQARLKAMDAR